MYIYTCTRLYMKKYRCIYFFKKYINASLYSSIDTLLMSVYGCKCARYMSFKRQDQ